MKRVLFFLIIAALFCPIPHHLWADENPYQIEISISKCRLYLFEKKGGEIELVREYLVATVKRGLSPFPFGPGRVTRIELYPAWFPTAYSRQYFRKVKGIILPAKVPYGDKLLNYMGDVKIHLSHSTWKGAIYRIHGNNSPSLVGKRVTGGCFRMHNNEGVELAKKIKIGTPVLIKE